MRLFTAVLAILLPLASASAQGLMATWSLEADLRIGAVDDGPNALHGLTHISVSSRTGAVFVAQYGRIGVFDAFGTHLRTFGRRGDGPGEFSRLTGLGWSGESLVAFKPSPGSAMHFTEDGALLDDRQITVAALRDGPSLLRGNPVASLVGDQYLWRAWTSRVPGRRPFDPLLRTDGRGGDLLLDRLAGDPHWREPPLTGVQRLTGPSMIAADPEGSGFVVVHQHAPAGAADARYRVRKVDSSGRVLYARTYAFTPLPVPPNYADSLIQAGVEIISSHRAYPNLKETLRRHTRVPRFQPPITDVLLAVDGSVWLRREDVHVATVDWTVLDRAGNPAGRLTLPARLKILYVDGDCAWGVERDNLDVEYAVRFRVRR